MKNTHIECVASACWCGCVRAYKRYYIDVHVGFRKRKNYIYHCLKTHAYTCAFTPLTLANSLLLNAIQVTGFQWIANAWRQWNKTLFYYFIMLVLRSMLLSILRFIRILVADFFFTVPRSFCSTSLLVFPFSKWNFFCELNWVPFQNQCLNPLRR